MPPWVRNSNKVNAQYDSDIISDMTNTNSADVHGAWPLPSVLSIVLPIVLPRVLSRVDFRLQPDAAVLPAGIELSIAPYAKLLALFQIDADSRSELGAYLPAEEISRADKFKFRADRQRFIAARLLLRCRLSQLDAQLNPRRRKFISPSAWQVAAPAQGKPYLRGPAASSFLPYFNLSHAGDYVALALSCEQKVGLDIERTRKRRPNIRGIASILFSAQEQEELQRLQQEKEDIAEQYFFQLWCRYEALSKLEGTGLLARAQDFKPAGSAEGQFSCPESGIHYYWALNWL